MSTLDQQLTSDHKKVVDTIRLYKNINLISTSGEPPEEYDIEYKLQGYSRAANGKVRINKQHRLKFQLPFGYPHFPPTIKPLSPIFHPDIDDSAIRIADYWEENKSLPDLILHIGEMICGKVYSSDNPFNKEAAEYYEKNQSKLPLDSLRLVKDEKRQETTRPPLEFNIPVAKIAIVLIVLALIGSGILFFLEKTRLDKAGDIFKKAQIMQEDLEYKRAQKTAQSALDSLKSFYLLRSSRDSLQEDINSFMQSKSLQEGLKGKIIFEGKYVNIERVHKLELLEPLVDKAKKYEELGEISAAIDAYEKALGYANDNSLDSEGDEIHRDLANLQLQQLLSSSENAHKSKNWSQAIKRHKAVLDYIQKHKDFLDGFKKQEDRTRYLLTLDQIALYSQKASQAEASNNLDSALNNYNALIEYIGKTGSKNNSTLKNVLVESMQKAAIVSEKINIRNRREWLLSNYKEIFTKHYPATIAATLSSPQAIFVRYEGNSLIFDLSCLDKGQGSIARLKIYYQYDPEIQDWKIFSGEI